MTDLLDLIAEGDRLRDEAFTNLDASDSYDENDLLRHEITKLARSLDVFSANDMPEWVCVATNPNRRGRMFRALVEEGVLTEVGMVKSSNPKAHGKRVLTYRLVAARPATTAAPNASNQPSEPATSPTRRRPRSSEA